ncbi:4-hydroxybenzoate polyprenyltransferase [Lanmaoa asiatica]|nr:4-hydroxybenzoate polyprenyltransferase [Lanmaoa asiatica]
MRPSSKFLCAPRCDMSSLLASRLAQKCLQTRSLSCSTRNLVLRRSPKSCLVTKPNIAIAPKLLVRYSSSVTPPPTWVDRFPVGVRPYIYLTRVDKPIGTFLLFYPCARLHPAWSISMASYAHDVTLTTSLTYLGLFSFCALVMRGAGCTINDMWDKNLDKAVERTCTRPLARGDITRSQALVFLAGQLTAGIAIFLQLNTYSTLLGVSSLSIVTIYPLMKRITYWPQAVLGLAFNWGALLGWSAVAGAVNWSVCLPLYAGGICWTLVYDSIYAHQDKIDDVKVGIRSTALLFGEHTRSILSTLSVSSMSLITYAGILNAQGAPFYFGRVAGEGLLAVGGLDSGYGWELSLIMQPWQQA